jgi:hypothetical protein
MNEKYVILAFIKTKFEIQLYIKSNEKNINYLKKYIKENICEKASHAKREKRVLDY